MMANLQQRLQSSGYVGEVMLWIFQFIFLGLSTALFIEATF